MEFYSHERTERLLAKRPVEPKPYPKVDPARWGEYDDYLTARGLSPKLARENGWYPSTGVDGFPRIVIPASNSGGWAFWQARDISGESNKRYQSPSGPRGDSVVIVWAVPARTREVVIVEGPMDALAAAGEGATAVALMGNTPPFDAWKFIAQTFWGHPFILCCDRDSPDAGAMWLTNLASVGRPSRLVLPTPYKDLAAVPQSVRTGILGLTNER